MKFCSEICSDFAAKFICVCAFLFVYILSGEMFLFKIVQMNLTKKVAKIVRPIKTQLHFNPCFITKYISIRSNRRWLRIIWPMPNVQWATYLQMFFQLYYHCKDQQSCIFVFVACLTVPSSNKGHQPRHDSSILYLGMTSREVYSLFW